MIWSAAIHPRNMAEDHPLTHEEASRVRTLLATFYSERSDAPLTEIFSICDSNHDGVLSSKELKRLLNAILDDVVRDGEVEAMVQKADVNHDGVIELSEFIAAMMRTTAI